MLLQNFGAQSHLFLSPFMIPEVSEEFKVHSTKQSFCVPFSQDLQQNTLQKYMNV